MAVKPIPDGYPEVIPSVIAESVARVIEFTAALGGKERMRMEMPGGRIAHAEVEFPGGGVVMFGDAGPEVPANNASIGIYVPDVDATYKAALAAGATSQSAPEDQFHGERSASVIDVAGNRWTIMTHIEDVSPEEMEARAAKLFGGG